jgi:dephospho-CoA kinase
MVIGVIGKIAAGKTFVIKQLLSVNDKKSPPINYISIDNIRRDILYNIDSDENCLVRSKLIKELKLPTQRNKLSGAMLGEKIFFDQRAMAVYRRIVNPIIRKEVKKQIKNNKGIVFIEWSNLIMDNLVDLVTAVILVKTAEKVRRSRLADSDLPVQQLKQRDQVQAIGGGHLLAFKKRGIKLLATIDTSRPISLGRYKRLWRKVIKYYYGS